MSDRIEIAIGRTILYTQEILDAGAAHWRAARGGLIKMAASIESAAPGHPALETLRRFIAEGDARCDERGVRH